MEDSIDIYSSFINCLLRLSYHCKYEYKIKHEKSECELCNILEKLSDKECELLANYVLKAYQDGILNTLMTLEGINEYANMKVRIRNTDIPAETFRGIVSDYMEYYKKGTWMKE